MPYIINPLPPWLSCNYNFVAVLLSLLYLLLRQHSMLLFYIEIWHCRQFVVCHLVICFRCCAPCVARLLFLHCWHALCSFCSGSFMPHVLLVDTINLRRHIGSSDSVKLACERSTYLISEEGMTCRESCVRKNKIKIRKNCNGSRKSETITEIFFSEAYFFLRLHPIKFNPAVGLSEPKKTVVFDCRVQPNAFPLLK